MAFDLNSAAIMYESLNQAGSRAVALVSEKMSKLELVARQTTAERNPGGCDERRGAAGVV